MSEQKPNLPPGWTVEIFEVSNNVYMVTANHESGARAETTDHLLDRAFRHIEKLCRTIDLRPGGANDSCHG